MNALLIPDRGTVRIAGLDAAQSRNWPTIRRTVGMVFQHPDDQIVATLVDEDVAFGPENLGVPPDEIRSRVRVALETVGLWEARLRPPHQLSAGQMQRVAIAGALAMRPRCLVFDEATAMLDPEGRRMVRTLMQRLHAEGLTIVAITHFMEEALDAQRVVVLHQGSLAIDAAPNVVFSDTERLRHWGLALPPILELTHRVRQRWPALRGAPLTPAALAEALTALPHQTAPDQDNTQPSPLAVATTSPFIEVHGLVHTYMRDTPLEHRALTDVSLAVPEHTTHGLLGATGSGKSTLLQHLNGLLRPQSGYVRVGAFDLSDPTIDVRHLRRMVGLVFQMPELQIFEQYVGDEIAYGPRLLSLRDTELRERVRWAMRLVALDFDAYKDRLTFTLSGGEQRRVALASVLALQPEVLLLDEPTAGLDPQTRVAIVEHLRDFQAQGMTLIISSHHIEMLAELAAQVTVLSAGRTALSGTPEAVFSDAANLHRLGLEQPLVMQVVAELRQRGWALPAGIVTPDQLLTRLEARLE